ncbi:hypothetical protein [Spirillospora sp. NPDC047279]|uniref:hypothetical protein n=1 Tax=Spirillospora sp. NPDC047279 TaxID=3155478 RepID=UPI0033D0F30E
MTAIDARWFADKGTAASWTHALLVQPGLEDAEVAAEVEDWGTCLLACLLTVERLAFCEMVLDGRAASPREIELLLALDGEPTPATRGLRELHRLRAEAGPHVGRACAEAALTCLATADAHVRSRIPIDVLPMRTPEGFYPSLRVAATLEHLRKAVGLGPFQWDWWANLS